MSSALVGLPAAGADEVVRRAVSESIGRGKVDRGLVHPYFASLGKSLLRAWDAERAVTREGLRGYGEQMAENAQTFTKLWMEKAAEYGASGSPLDAPERADAPRGPPTSFDTRGLFGDGASLAARREVQKTVARQFAARRRAVVRVTQRPSGELLEVELLRPSSDAKVDREAVADIRAAAARLPPPPPEAVRPDGFVRSEWEFELIVSISPPVPTFSFEFDEALKFADARLPLDRRITKRVRLLSVE